MIEAKNIDFSYANDKKNNLKNCTLSIDKGECVLLCGRSGCGKTTITKLINGLIPNFYENCKISGDVFVDDMKVSDVELYQFALKVGSVFQNPKSQFFHLDSDSELAFSLENAGVNREEIHKRLKKTVTTLNIKRLLNRNVFHMSGGEKQILAFGSAYVTNPKILVLDEPTANLDTLAVNRLRKLLKVAKSAGITIVIAEHRLWFLKDLIDRALYIVDGEIKSEYNVKEFFSMNNKELAEKGLRSCIYEKINIPKAVEHGLLEVKNLEYKYNNRYVFKDISFAINKGEVLGIVGENGAGKSTLMDILTGVKKPNTGEILYNGIKLKRKELQKKAFLIMQDVNYQLFSDSILGECQIGNNKEKIAIQDVLKEFSLLDYQDVHPMALSGGQKQRLAVATAILSGREILLFDEPTSGLDYESMKAVAKMIKEQARKERIVIVVSHDNELLNLCANRIFTLSNEEKYYD